MEKTEDLSMEQKVANYLQQNFHRYFEVRMDDYSESRPEIPTYVIVDFRFLENSPVHWENYDDHHIATGGQCKLEDLQEEILKNKPETEEGGMSDLEMWKNIAYHRQKHVERLEQKLAKIKEEL